MRTRPSRPKAIAASGLMILAASAASTFGAISFKNATSSITFTHEVIEGGTSRSVAIGGGVGGPAIPTGGGTTFPLPDLTMSETTMAGTLTSRAVAGMGQTTTTTTGSGTIKSGTLITQSDPSNISSEFSVLTIAYNLQWDVTPTKYGPPITGAFNVPLLAIVGTGGAGEASIIDMNWERFDGITTTDLRTPANVTVSFTPGATLTSLTVPSAAFSPTSLLPADDLIVRGTVKIKVKNAVDPVRFYYELPDYNVLIADDAPVIHYRFNEPAPGAPAMGTVEDSSPIGGANNGVYQGNVFYTPAGVRDKAVDFGSPTDFVQASIQSFQSFTAEFWAASDEPGVWQNPGQFVNAIGANGFRITPVAGTPQWNVFLQDSLGSDVFIGTFNSNAFDITQFHHFALAYDAATDKASVYLDGTRLLESLALGISRLPGTALNLILGQNLFGRLDEFAYYDYALRPEVLQAHALLGQANPDLFNRIIGANAPDDVEELIPEPASILLSGLGLSALAIRRRRQDA